MGLSTERVYRYGSNARPPHREVGAVIASFIRDEAPGEPAYVSAETLAMLTGKTERPVRYSIDHLVDLGEYEVEKRKGRTSLYVVRWAALSWPDSAVLASKVVGKAGPLVAQVVGLELPKPSRRRVRTPATGSRGNPAVPTDAEPHGTTANPGYSQPDTPATGSRTPRLRVADEPHGTPSDMGAAAPPSARGAAVVSPPRPAWWTGVESKDEWAFIDDKPVWAFLESDLQAFLPDWLGVSDSGDAAVWFMRKIRGNPRRLAAVRAFLRDELNRASEEAAA